MLNLVLLISLYFAMFSELLMWHIWLHMLFVFRSCVWVSQLDFDILIVKKCSLVSLVSIQYTKGLNSWVLDQLSHIVLHHNWYQSEGFS